MCSRVCNSDGRRVRAATFSAPILERKLVNIEKTGTPLVLIDRHGCVMQIRGGMDIARSRWSTRLRGWRSAWSRRAELTIRMTLSRTNRFRGIKEWAGKVTGRRPGFVGRYDRAATSLEIFDRPCIER